MRNILKMIVLVSVLALLLWAYAPTLLMNSPRLAFQWEGFLASKLNFRDTAASINQCLGREALAENHLFRASGFFSGWSCRQVGDPDLILSLNYSESEGRRYYCRKDDGFLIGTYFQSAELADLEFLDTWNDGAAAAAVCKHVQRALQEVRSGRKVLVHCDAGRDRAGAVSALLGALLLEESGPLSDEMIDALECDYRKTASLKSYKHGRIKTFVTALRDQYGSVHEFIKIRCDF